MELLPCPFCGCAMRIRSNRDTHKLVGDHTEACIYDDDPIIEIDATDEILADIVEAWNRRASPASAPEGLFVREDVMHESNGRVTYFVHLAKSQDAKPWDCYVVYSDAIQGRAQYEAAQLRHFLGQGPKPDILTFDTDAPTPPVSEDRKDAERLHAILETLKMEFYIAEIDAHHPEVHAIRKLRTSLFAKLTEILKAPATQEDKP